MFQSCKKCTTDRYPGCHDHCEKYRAEKERYEQRKAELAVDRSLKQYFCYNAAENSDKAAKKHKHRRGIAKIPGG